MRDKNAEEMPRQPGGGETAGAGFETTDYTDVLKEAMVGNATIKDMTPAITQRTNREIVSLTAE